MDGVLGPQARMLIIGHFLRSSVPELQQGGQYFAQKYQHSSYAEERAKVTVERILTILNMLSMDMSISRRCFHPGLSHHGEHVSAHEPTC